MKYVLVILVCLLYVTTGSEVRPKYEATWESLDSRPLPDWYDEAKVGIFIHWGVFSVPSIGSEWFWWWWKSGGGQVEASFMQNNYPPGFTYQDFGTQFTAEFYDPSKWAAIFQKSGAKYIVFTSKHHEGYTMWPSKYSFSWNAMDVGAHRDLLGDLSTAIRQETDLRLGLYHSKFEWYNPLYVSDMEGGYWTDDYVQHKYLPEITELVNTYQPDILWCDGEWEASDEYWKSKEFLAWLYNESPIRDTVITNDRWGNNTRCEHGGFYNCDDKYNPGVLPPYKWENCMSLDTHSWGYRRNARIQDYLTPEQLLKTLVETISCGGNLLVNVGPTKEGVIVPIQEERLLQLGDWLGINGQAVYSSKPWIHQNDTITSGVWYTSNSIRQQVYAFTLNWPGQEPLHLGAVDPAIVSSVGLFGFDSELTWTPATPDAGIKVHFPRPDQVSSKWTWTVIINEN